MSEADPPLTAKIDPAFGYVGRDRFALKGRAAVERHHWVKGRDGAVEAMIVFQFEGLLAGTEGAYRFSIPPRDQAAGSNYRFSPERVRLGDHTYVHNTWAYDDRANARDNPGAESDRTRKLLLERGWRIDDALIMSRFVREVGDSRRKEVILFYIEPLRRSGHTLDQFPDGEPPTAIFDRLSAEVVARGRSAFSIVSETATPPP